MALTFDSQAQYIYSKQNVTTPMFVRLTVEHSRPEFSGQKIPLGLTYPGGLSTLDVFFDQLNLEVRDQMKSGQRMCRYSIDNL